MEFANAMNSEIQVGMPAPDFSLQDENEQVVTLSALRGKPVVLMFYPFDWSGLCTLEHCDLRDAQPGWEHTGAQVYGISRDSTYSHKAWKAHLGLGYSLLADLSGDVARKYGAWNEQEHRADRMTVVIDPHGIVRYVVHNHAGRRRDMAEVVASLKETAAASRA